MNGSSQRGNDLLSVGREKQIFGTKVSVDPIELDLALQKGNLALARIAELENELTDERAKAGKEVVVQEIVQRDLTRAEIEELVRKHPLFVNLEASANGIDALRKENEVLRAHSVLVGMEAHRMVGFAVDASGKPKRDMTAHGRFYIFNGALGGPGNLYAEIPREVGDCLRIRREGTGIGAVEFEITLREESGGKYIQVRLVSLDGRFLPDPKNYELTRFMADIMTPEGFFHTPPNPELVEYGSFRINMMLAKGGKLPTMVEVIILGWSVQQQSRKHLARQVVTARVETAPDASARAIEARNDDHTTNGAG